jgi:hypothetical protein
MANWSAVESIPEITALLSQPAPPPPSRSAAPRPPPNPNVKPAITSAPSSNHPTGGWECRNTSDGVPYYYNFLSDSVTWDKPDALKSQAERNQDDGEWVWVSDPTEAWVPARVQTRAGNKVTVVLDNGSSSTVMAGPREPLWPLSKSSLRDLADDMVMVDSLNSALMIHLLKERYIKDNIYTWVGASHTVLVSINPFKQLPIYTVSTMTEFAHPSPNKLDPPHTFAIASSAFSYMSSERKNQAILISGESGAGTAI